MWKRFGRFWLRIAGERERFAGKIEEILERERINEEEGRRNALYLIKPTERESSEFCRNPLLSVREYFWRFAFAGK